MNWIPPIGPNQRVERFQRGRLPDQHVLGDEVGFVELLSQLALVLDDPGVDDVESSDVFRHGRLAGAVVAPSPIRRKDRKLTRGGA